MRLFQDNAKRTWVVHVDVNAVKRVRSMADFELLQIVEGEGNPVLELYNDLPKLVDVMWALVAPQAIEQGVGPEDFGSQMVGDPLADAFEQLIGGLIDFFPSGRRRILRATAAEAGLAIEVDEKDKLSLLGESRRPTLGRNCSRWRAAWAWCRERFHSANCG